MIVFRRSVFLCMLLLRAITQAECQKSITQSHGEPEAKAASTAERKLVRRRANSGLSQILCCARKPRAKFPPSFPARPTVVTPTAIFCGEIILPVTAPEEVAARAIPQ